MLDLRELELLDAELVGCCGSDLVGDDSWLTIHTRADYTNAVTQLKASADSLNLTAQSEPGWKPLYDNAQRLYDKYHDVGFFSSINPFGDQSLGDSAWTAIADAQRRVDEFAEQMRTQKKVVLEPRHKPIDSSLLPQLPKLPDASALSKYLPWVIGGVVVVGLGSVALPVVIPLLAARRLSR